MFFKRKQKEMSEDEFWKIIQISIDQSRGNYQKQLDALSRQLKSLSKDNLDKYSRIFHLLHDKAYMWSLWEVAYIMNGGCGDDGFIDFRYWLISRGRKIFEAVLENPDNIADFPVKPDEEGFYSFEEFGYVAMEVYDEKFNGEVPDLDFELKREPAGDRHDEDDENEMKKLYPKTFEKFYEKCQAWLRE
jgi:hypothetical protein